MATLVFFLTLVSAVCVAPGVVKDARNNAPCLKSPWNNGYDTFLRRHIRKDAPTSLDQNEWQKFIRNSNLCDRPTQSFLKAKDKDLVNNVCSPRGGKTYKENLCISNKVFTFVRVRIQTGTCEIRRVQEETKHLILACDLQDNRCLPVHFQGNPNDETPDNYLTPCQAPMKDGLPSSFKKSWLPLLSVLLLILCVF